jgi:hypothetical protein
MAVTPIHKRTLVELRTFIRNKRTPHVYSIFAVIRGPDNNGTTKATDEKHLKCITKALRSYIGFDDENCEGNLIWNVSNLQTLKTAIEFVDKQKESYTASHYVLHLYYALNAVGRNNLLAFAGKKI